MRRHATPLRELELDIEKIVHGGQGLARIAIPRRPDDPGTVHDRFVVFVDDVLPGERVVASVYQRKRSHAFARATQVLRASPDRVEADCPRFGRCGGCSFRHCRYAAQLPYKKAVLLEALHGVCDPSLVQDVVPSPAQEDYRGKMVFAFGETLEGELRLGMHRRGSYIHVLDADCCRLQSAVSRELVRRVRGMAVAHGWHAFHEIQKTPGLRTLAIRESRATGERMAELSATEFPPGLAEAFLEAAGDLATSVILSLDRHLHGPPHADERTFLKGDGWMEEKLNDFRFRIGPDTFFQNNPAQAAALFARLRELARAGGKRKVALDLFSGTGPIAFHLADVAETVVAAETWAPSVFVAKENARLNGIANVRFLEADVNAASAAALFPEKVDLVAVDPPRPGLSEDAVSAILALAPEEIFYVSCNPATLARDLKRFCGGGAYAVANVEPYDFFPHTFHLETLVRMERTKAEGAAE
jgi:23S rRNA (uracil1939-C5)-methyltransferase